MKTLCVALSVLSTAPLALAQDFKALVTLKTTGMTVGEVVAKIKEASKADLRVTPQVAKEIVLVDVDQVPAKDLMAKLASTLGGEWAKSDSTYQLLVKDTAIKKAVSARIARDTEAVKKAVAKLVERVKPDEAYVPPKGGGPQIESGPGSTQVFLMAGGGTATEKPLASIIQTLSPATIASIAPGARVVFSNAPFGVQLPLPGTADRFIRRAMADELSAALNGNVGRSQVIIGPDKVDRSVERLKRGVYGRAYLAIRRQGWSPSFVVTLTVLDPDGMSLLTGTTFLSEEGQEFFAFGGGSFTAARAISLDGGASGQPATAPAADDGQPIVLSEKAKALAHIGAAQSLLTTTTDVVFVAVGSDSGEVETSLLGGGTRESAGAARATMKDPVVNDPLSFFVGEAVRQTMPADKPVVALLSDELFNQMRPTMAQDGVKDTTVKKLLTDNGYSYAEADGWVTLSPVDIDRCRQHRIDRHAFKRLLDSAQLLGAAPLTAVAQYAVVSPDTNQSLWDTTYANALYGSAMSKEVSDTRGNLRQALRIFAGMNENERRTVGSVMSMTALGSPMARRELADLIFRSNDGPRPTNGPKQPNDLAVAMTSSFPNPDMPDINSLFGPAFERTDVFNGVPPQSALGMEGKDEVALRVLDPKTGQSQIMSPEEIGNMKAMGEQPWGASFAQGIGDDKKVQVLTKRRVNFQFSFAGRYQMRRSLSDYVAAPNSQPVAWTDLPVEVQDKIANAYKRSVDAYKNGNIQFAQGTNGAVPPPQG